MFTSPRHENLSFLRSGLEFRSDISLQDATTNPSLILAAAGKAGYAKLIDTAVAYAKEKGGDINAQVENATDRLVSETDGLAAGRTWLRN